MRFFAGESSTLVAPYVPGGVSDGQWHTVQLLYYNKVCAPFKLPCSAAGLALASCSPGIGAFPKAAFWESQAAQRSQRFCTGG